MMNGTADRTKESAPAKKKTPRALIIFLLCIAAVLTGVCLRAALAPSETRRSSSADREETAATTEKRAETKPSYPLSAEPYVGMRASEWQISHWEWQGTDYRTCGVKTTKYRYDAEQGDYTVWIDENNVVLKVSKSAPPEKPRKGTSSGGGKNDGPGVDGFADVEDFYDFYYDDFIDFDEAEEYYEEHGGY